MHATLQQKSGIHCIGGTGNTCHHLSGNNFHIAAKEGITGEM
jgi:hypothetical protein